MHARDTTAEAAAMQRRVIASMTGEQRVLAASAMADDVREVTLAGLRSRHPDARDDELHELWLELLHGPTVVAEIRQRRT